MTLQYNVSQLLKSDVGEIRSYDFELDEPIDLDGTSATGVQGHVKFTLTNFGILAAVHADAMLHLTCSRCLDVFAWPAHVRFEEQYQPVIDVTSGLPTSVPRDGEVYLISNNHTLDLTDAVRENLLLAVDMKPLCRADCQGLCPTCGVNRNTEVCICPPQEEPSPFAVLQGLLGRTDAEE